MSVRIKVKQDDLIAMLNPIIKGWTNYHQRVAAKRIFSRMDKSCSVSYGNGRVNGTATKADGGYPADTGKP
jgi:hypothetical protein